MKSLHVTRGQNNVQALVWVEEGATLEFDSRSALVSLSRNYIDIIAHVTIPV